MNPADLVMLIVRGIATLTHNKALGFGGIGSERTAFLLNTLSVLIEGGESTWEELKRFSVEIQALVDQNGEPTRGQWEAMVARDLASRKMLDDNLSAALLAEANPTQEAQSNAAPQTPSLKPGEPAGGGANLSLNTPLVDPPL